MFSVANVCSDSADATAAASAKEVRPVATMFIVLPVLVVHSSGHCADRAALHSCIQLVLLDCQRPLL